MCEALHSSRVIIFFAALFSLALVPSFFPAVIVWKLTHRGSSRFQEARRSLLRYPVLLLLLLLQPCVGAGWYQLVPGEDREGLDLSEYIGSHSLAFAGAVPLLRPLPHSHSLMGPAMTTDPNCL